MVSHFPRFTTSCGMSSVTGTLRLQNIRIYHAEEDPEAANDGIVDIKRSIEEIIETASSIYAVRYRRDLQQVSTGRRVTDDV